MCGENFRSLVQSGAIRCAKSGDQNKHIQHSTLLWERHKRLKGAHLFSSNSLPPRWSGVNASVVCCSDILLSVYESPSCHGC